MTGSSLAHRVWFAVITIVSLINTTLGQEVTGSMPFNVTAVTAVNGSSVLQCWQLTDPVSTLTLFDTPGISYLPMGNAANISYTAYPPKTDLGPHQAPMVQWIIAISGLAHVTLPNTTAGPETESWFQGGRYGIMFADDTAGVSQYGHTTAFPGDAETVLIFVATANGTTPGHEVLHSGPCQWSELTGTSV